MRILAMVLAVSAGAALAEAPKVCDVRAFGARGDGKTKDTVAIQKAIDACAPAGGTVKLGGGMFLSGPIVLKSGVTFEIAKDATLLGSTDFGDYPKTTFARQPTLQPLVSTLNAENVTITGGGTIDGQGKVWWDAVQNDKDKGVLGNDHPRPMGVVFDHSRHIKMDGITVQNSGFWQIVPYYSQYVELRNLRILAPKSPNTDAIDPFSSSHVVIDHVYSSIGDDNVAIKSGAIDSPGPDDPSTDITITDCTFAQGHGLSIGSELSGGAQHIHAERIHFMGTDNGIRIKANRDRGHDVSDITFKDIDMEDVKVPILVSEYYPKMYPEGDVAAAPVGRLTPVFHDIHIDNVRATGAQTAGVIVGLPESRVTDIELTNVSIRAKTGFRIAYADVTLEGLNVKAEDGEGVMVSPTAKVRGR